MLGKGPGTLYRVSELKEKDRKQDLIQDLRERQEAGSDTGSKRKTGSRIWNRV
jgi:hypothetical protein